MSLSIGEGFKHKINGKYGNIIAHIDDQGKTIAKRVKYVDGSVDTVRVEDLEEYPVDMNGRHILVGDKILYPVQNGYPYYICQGTVVKINAPNKWKDILISIKPDNGYRVKSGNSPNQCVVIDQEIIKERKLNDYD